MHRIKRLGLAALIAVSASVTAQAQVTLLPPESVQPAAAGTEAGSVINETAQREWVQLSATGSISGGFKRYISNDQSVNEAGARITLTRDGRIVAEVRTDATGSFVVDRLAPGTYGLIAKSPTAVAAFALHVLPHGASATLPSDVDIYGASASGPVVEELLRKFLIPGGSTGGYYRDYKTDPLGDRRISTKQPIVRLRDGNVLVGRISKPGWEYSQQDLSGSVVHILQNGRLITTAGVNREGFFQIPNFAPGTYDLVVVGSGVAVTGFRAVAPNQKVSQSAAKVVYVSFQGDDSGDTLNIEMIDPTDWYTGSTDQLPPGTEDPNAPGMFAPFPGGGFAGPGGFGGGAGGGAGGAGGGLGGAGGLIGLAGLGAGIAALSSNSDGFNLNLATPIK